MASENCGVGELLEADIAQMWLVVRATEMLYKPCFPPDATLMLTASSRVPTVPIAE